MTGADEFNFSHRLLLTDRHVASLRKVFANNSLTNINISKTQLSKVIRSVVFLGRLLWPLIKLSLLLMKNMFQPLAIQGGDGLIRAVDEMKNKGFLMLPYSLNDLKIQR